MPFDFGGGEGQSIVFIFLVLIPASLYIAGLVEGKKGRAFFIAGVIFHIAGIITRSIYLGRIPLTEKFDNISFMALSMALVYLYFGNRKGLKDISITSIPLVSLFIIVSLMFPAINTISPFMNSPLFYIHMFFFFVGYGFFGISAVIGAHYLLNKKPEYEVSQYRSAIHGWIMLSISLVAGSAWFYFAYGTYWLWTSRELWMMLTWFHYGLYLHVRFIKGLRGAPASVTGIIGFLVALFAYFGVGTIIPSPPTQF